MLPCLVSLLLIFLLLAIGAFDSLFVTIDIYSNNKRNNDIISLLFAWPWLRAEIVVLALAHPPLTHRLQAACDLPGKKISLQNHLFSSSLSP